MCYLFKYPLLPSKIINVYESTDHYEVIISPLEKNFSSSFANLLRRIILSYTIGLSVVGLKIRGVNSEFDTLSGVREDIIQVIMNIKNIAITSRVPIDKPRKLYIKERGPKVIYASSLYGNDDLEILNKDVQICTLTDNSIFQMEVDVVSGTGYYVPPSSSIESQTIPIDATFCPVNYVSYTTNTYPTYEELAFHVKTNGSVPAKDVFYHGLSLLFRKIEMLV